MDPLSWQETVKKSKRAHQLGIFPIREKSITKNFKEKRTDLIQQNNSKRLISKLLDDLWKHFRKLSFGHHVQPRVTLHVPNEGAFLVPEAKTITITFEESRTGLTIGHVHESRIVPKTTSIH